MTVVGGGLAGCEAAWQIARRGCAVTLIEMRPIKMTPAHRTGEMAELVCSNSLGSDERGTAAGLLKAELRMMDSLIMSCADKTRVPAGSALAGDREAFSRGVSSAIFSHPMIEVLREEAREIPQGICVIATGPLTSDGLAGRIREFTGHENLYFYDAAAPVVIGESIDMEYAFEGARYGKGAGYLNCPLDRDQYEIFWRELVSAEQHPRKSFEEAIFFEGCLPVEEIARRGKDTLRFGPMKPVGLVDPRTGKRPYAVLQLRMEDAQGTLYNLVGFQTNLKWGEQRRVFRLIPALHRAEFVRFGVMHRNTFLNGPRVLLDTLQSRIDPRVFFAGQRTGVEGYLESTATGLVAGINAWLLATGRSPVVFPPETALGSLVRYVSSADPKHFQPMNINFGILPKPDEQVGRKKREAVCERAVETLEGFRNVLT